MIDTLELMSNTIVNKNHRCCCNNIFTFLAVLIRLRKHNTQDGSKIVFRKKQTWFMRTYCTLFCLLKEHYEACELTPSYLQFALFLLR